MSLQMQWKSQKSLSAVFIAPSQVFINNLSYRMFLQLHHEYTAKFAPTVLAPISYSDYMKELVWHEEVGVGRGCQGMILLMTWRVGYSSPSPAHPRNSQSGWAPQSFLETSWFH